MEDSEIPWYIMTLCVSAVSIAFCLLLITFRLVLCCKQGPVSVCSLPRFIFYLGGVFISSHSLPFYIWPSPTHRPTSTLGGDHPETGQADVGAILGVTFYHAGFFLIYTSIFVKLHRSINLRVVTSHDVSELVRRRWLASVVFVTTASYCIMWAWLYSSPPDGPWRDNNICTRITPTHGLAISLEVAVFVAGLYLSLYADTRGRDVVCLTYRTSFLFSLVATIVLFTVRLAVQGCQLDQLLLLSSLRSYVYLVLTFGPVLGSKACRVCVVSPSLTHQSSYFPLRDMPVTITRSHIRRRSDRRRNVGSLPQDADTPMTHVYY